MVWLVFIAVLICMGAFLFYASYSIRSGVYVKALCRGNTDKRVVCLTFDDGPVSFAEKDALGCVVV